MSVAEIVSSVLDRAASVFTSALSTAEAAVSKAAGVCADEVTKMLSGEKDEDVARMDSFNSESASTQAAATLVDSKSDENKQMQKDLQTRKAENTANLATAKSELLTEKDTLKKLQAQYKEAQILSQAQVDDGLGEEGINPKDIQDKIVAQKEVIAAKEAEVKRLEEEQKQIQEEELTLKAEEESLKVQGESTKGDSQSTADGGKQGANGADNTAQKAEAETEKAIEEQKEEETKAEESEDDKPATEVAAGTSLIAGAKAGAVIGDGTAKAAADADESETVDSDDNKDATTMSVKTDDETDTDTTPIASITSITSITPVTPPVTDNGLDNILPVDLGEVPPVDISAPAPIANTNEDEENKTDDEAENETTEKPVNEDGKVDSGDENKPIEDETETTQPVAEETEDKTEEAATEEEPVAQTPVKPKEEEKPTKPEAVEDKEEAAETPADTELAENEFGFDEPFFPELDIIDPPIVFDDVYQRIENNEQTDVAMADVILNNMFDGETVEISSDEIIGMEAKSAIEYAAENFKAQTYSNVVYKNKVSAKMDSATIQENQEAVSDFMEAYSIAADKVNAPDITFLSLTDKSNFDAVTRVQERLNDGEYILTREVKKATSTAESIQVSTDNTKDTKDAESKLKGENLLDRLKIRITPDENAPEDKNDDILTKKEFDELYDFFENSDNISSAYDSIVQDAKQYNVFVDAA